MGFFKYVLGLFKIASRTGKIPMLNHLYKAYTAGKMSRREFLTRTKDIGKEANLQGKYIGTLDKFEQNRQIGATILDKNKSLVEKVDAMYREANRRNKISKSLIIKNKTKKFLADKKKLKQIREERIDEAMHEAEISLLSPKERSQYRKELRKQVAQISDHNVALRRAEENVRYRQKDKILDFQDKVQKEMGLSNEQVGGILKARNYVKNGYSGNFGNKLLDKYFKTRDEFGEFAGLSHTQRMHYYKPNYMQRKGTEAGFPGVKISDIPNTEKKAKTMWQKALEDWKKAFYEGYADDVTKLK